jgi:hypothetical protein
MSRMPTSHTNRPAIRAIGWSTLALLATGIAPVAAALGHCGDGRPPTAPAAARVAPKCATAGPLLSIERFLCYRAVANLANERFTLPSLAVDQTADATSGIGSAEGTGVSRSGSATRQ